MAAHEGQEAHVIDGVETETQKCWVTYTQQHAFAHTFGGYANFHPSTGSNALW